MGKLFLILRGLGVRVSVDFPDADESLLKAQSIKAQHRAAVRAFRAAERTAEKWKLRCELLSATPTGTLSTFPPEPAKAIAELFRKAKRVLDTASPDARASDTLTRARNVLAHSEEASKQKTSKGNARK